MELGGLSDRECRKLLSSREIPSSDFDEIIRKTEGHPLFLELVDSPAGVVTGDVKGFLRQEIASKLKEREKEILAIASVFRGPVSTSALFSDERIDHDVIDSLVSQALLSESDDAKYVIHDALKEFFYGQLPKSERREYHRQAGEYYSDFSDSESVLEAQYHLGKGGLYERAGELLTLHGDRLISEGFAEDLLNMLTAIENPEAWGPFATEVLLLRGRMLNLAGKWKEAIEDFKEVERFSADEEEFGTALDAASQTGEIIRKRGRNEEALKIFQAAEEQLSERTDISVTTRILKNFAMIYAAQTDFEMSYRYLSLMDDTTSELPTESERSDYFATKGSVLSLQNLHEEAMEAWKQALEICESNHDVLRLPTMYNGLGISLYDLEKNDLALEYFDRAIKFARRIGDLGSQGTFLLNTASIYIEKPDLSRAEMYLKDAEDIFDRLEERRSSALVELSRAFISYQSGEYADASVHIQKHLAAIEEYGAPTDLIYSFGTSAELYKEMGMLDEERKCSETAVSLSERPRKSAGTIDRRQAPENGSKTT
jgi:tetratricopeptide (TPR) repeat protein